MLQLAEFKVRFIFPGSSRIWVIASLFMLLSITDAKAFIDDIWQEYTPGKNIIGSNEDGRGKYLHYRNGELHQLKEWYFYKEHILGSFTTGPVEKYFVFNETNNRLQIFHLKEDFENHIRKHKLKPVFKRTYTYKWSLFPKESSLNYFTGFLFIFYGSIPVLLFQLLVFGIICIIMLIKGQLKSFINSTYELTAMVVKAVLWLSMYTVPIVLLFWYVKGSFPQSI